MEELCKSLTVSAMELDSTSFFLESLILRFNNSEMDKVKLREWERKLIELTKATASTKRIEADLEKKGLLEKMWEKLPPAKLSGNTYVKWNEALPKLLGKDNPNTEWDFDAEPGITLDNYKFLYLPCVTSSHRFQNHAKKLAYRKKVKERVAARIMKDYGIKEIPDFNHDTKVSPSLHHAPG